MTSLSNFGWTRPSNWYIYRLIGGRACPGKGQHFGNLVPLASDRFSVKIWDIATKKVVTTLTGQDNHVVLNHSVNFVPLVTLQ